MNRAEKRRQRKKADKAAKGAEPGLGQAPTIQQALQQAVRHHTQGRLAEAEALYQQILQVEPEQPSALNLLGVVAHQAGKFETAVDLITRAVAAQPDYAEAYYNLGNALKALGRLEDAVSSFQKSLSLRPDNAEVHNHLGIVYRDLGKTLEAANSFEKSLAVNPEYAEALGNLGNIWMLLGKGDEAATCYRKAIAINPDYAAGYCNLGMALKDSGQLDAAVASFRKALAIQPNFPGAGRNLLFGLLNIPGLSPEELFAEHQHFSENHARDITPITNNFANDADPDHRLRIGYMSSDFRNHPVGKNLLPLLTCHDREKVEVFCYADVPRPDAVTEQIRSSIEHWRPIVGQSDADVAKMVRADGIDILVCLAGHFDDNRPLVSAYRAAPVQVSFHDGATSGLEEMDYWLTDDFLHPTDTKELFTEELHRLPVFYYWAPINDAPTIGGLPADKAGSITFGSFNNPGKINDVVIRLWADVLKSVPGSELLLKYKNWYDQPYLCERIWDGIAASGVEPDRIRFAALSDTFADHLGQYGTVDIALDPFPFNGATTTFQALWMGVPVVALAGETFISRAAASLLHHIGLDELVADTPDAYVACARELAGDPERLRTFRAGLRERVAASALCDALAYARNIEDAYRDMWWTWRGKQ